MTKNIRFINIFMFILSGGIWGDYMGEPRDTKILRLFGDKEPTTSSVDDILDGLDQKVLEQIAKLSKENPHFSTVTDYLLREAAKLPEEEREGYVNEAYAFCSILTDCMDPEYFVRNFFGYLFEKTRNMTEKDKQDFVSTSKSISNALVITLDKKTGQKHDPESLIRLIRPNLSLAEHLRFERKDYQHLRTGIYDRRLLEEEDFDKDFYRIGTVADMVEYVAEKKGLVAHTNP
jgi:hypothetical protein